MQFGVDMRNGPGDKTKTSSNFGSPYQNINSFKFESASSLKNPGAITSRQLVKNGGRDIFN
jgi:hypothetical protein